MKNYVSMADQSRPELKTSKFDDKKIMFVLESIKYLFVFCALSAVYFISSGLDL